jgi:hypothetical protein
MGRRITIAGGGLAGLSLGIALRLRGVEADLHEASTYPRHRVCGEFLGGLRSGTLESLGIAECLADAEILQSAVWNDSSGPIGRLSADGRGISRWRLDDRLRQRFEQLGGRLFTNSRIQPREGVVWAAGRPRRKSPWIGLKCHARGLTLDADLEMFTAANGYVGLARIEDGLVNICGLFTKTPSQRAKGPALLLNALREGGLEILADRLRGADLMEGSFCGVAVFRTGHQPGPDFSIGDAASMIPPFTGHGMGMAFESAECALKPALDYAHGEKSWPDAARACAQVQHRRFGRRLAAASVLPGLLTTRNGSRLASALARRRLIPFQSLLQLVR